MLTISLYKKSFPKELNEYINQYTGLFYKLYNNADLMEDQSFIKEMLEKYNLFDKSMFDWCKSEVLMKLNQLKTNQKKQLKEKEDLIKELEKNDFHTKKELRYKYKIINKIKRLNRTANKNITFGGKQNLRQITKYKQKIKSKYTTTTPQLIISQNGTIGVQNYDY